MNYKIKNGKHKEGNGMMSKEMFNDTINTEERKAAKEKMLKELEINKDVTRIDSTDGSGVKWYFSPKQVVEVEVDGTVRIL